jgi:hypothetical protein
VDWAEDSGWLGFVATKGRISAPSGKDWSETPPPISGAFACTAPQDGMYGLAEPAGQGKGPVITR